MKSTTKRRAAQGPNEAQVRRTAADVAAEIRRQASMKHATWAGILLKDALVLCDEIDRLSGAPNDK